MSRTSFGIWKGAFSNVVDVIPPRPENLCFPAWAHLLYEKNCHVSWVMTMYS